MKYVQHITVERLRAVLDYSEESGAFTWRVSLNSRRPVGSRAGTVRDDGYRTIGIDGHSYLARRLAWLYVKGVWPVSDVDHRNTTPGDDRWENLREATRSQNKANIRAPKNNTSGIKGVTWNKKDRKWRAQTKINGKMKIIGAFDDKETAGRAYVDFTIKVFGEFARAA